MPSQVAEETSSLFSAANCIVKTVLIRHNPQGKDKVGFAPHLDSGDVVVVKNAKHVVFTGKKWKQKLYRHHTGSGHILDISSQVALALTCSMLDIAIPKTPLSPAGSQVVSKSAQLSSN